MCRENVFVCLFTSIACQPTQISDGRCCWYGSAIDSVTRGPRIRRQQGGGLPPSSKKAPGIVGDVEVLLVSSSCLTGERVASSDSLWPLHVHGLSQLAGVCIASLSSLVWPILRIRYSIRQACLQMDIVCPMLSQRQR